MKKVFLNEFTTKEIERKLKNNELDSAITVFGSCESHGNHMCLGPDLFVPTEIARQAALRLHKTIVVPGVPFGASMHYNQFPLSISMRFETIIAIAEDLFDSLILHGVKHILILNGHDGNIPALEIAARKVKDRHKEAVIVFVPAWWEITGAKMGEDFDVWNGLGHGGEGETSITMAVRPDLVYMADAVGYTPNDVIKLCDHSSIIWDIKEITHTGATGDPSKATREKGEKMLAIMVDYVEQTILAFESNNWNYDLRK
jgi:creatinine amidohydrolase